MIGYAINLGEMILLRRWLRLSLQEKIEKERAVLSWCPISQTKISQQRKALQNSDEKQYCQYWMLRLVVTD